MVIQYTLFVTNSLLLHCDRTPTIRDKFSAATLWSNTHYSWQIHCCYIVIHHPLFVTNSVLLHCDPTPTIRDKFSAVTLWSNTHYSWQIQYYSIVIQVRKLTAPCPTSCSRWETQHCFATGTVVSIIWFSTLHAIGDRSWLFSFGWGQVGDTVALSLRRVHQHSLKLAQRHVPLDPQTVERDNSDAGDITLSVKLVIGE